MLIYVLSILGVIVFAASGALAAGRKKFDLIGVVVIALVTAIGGGTLRDLLMRREVFWIGDPIYLWIVLASSIATIVYVRYWKPPWKLLLIADALGLALFSISGTQIALQSNLSGIVAVIMGILTGAAGGVLRDLLTGEIPIVCRSKETLYVTAVILGSSSYLILLESGIDHTSSALVGLAIVAGVRIAAIIWSIHLPTFALEE